MKREDIKMHFREESYAFLQGKIFIAVAFILLSIKIDAQIELNNFGKVDVVKSNSDYKNFLLIDANKDNVKDLFLFGKQSKEFTLQLGIKDSTFSNPIKKFFFYPIDDFKWFNKSKKGKDYYIFISRKLRIAGIVAFTKNYSLELLNRIKFSSYPTSIEVSDLNEDGKNEALIYGNNFNGIELIENRGYKLSSKLILDENLFTDLSIFDYNQDGMNDIVAVDILSNSIKFFDNADNLEFAENRSIETESTINSIFSFDYNSDSFSDIIFLTENSIEIYYGDSVYSFSKANKITPHNSPGELLFGDFNKNRKTDFVTLDRSNDAAVFNFDYLINDNTLKFGVENISEIKIDKNDLIIYKGEGLIYKISNKRKNDNEFSIIAGVAPRELQFISDIKNKTLNLIFNSNNENTLSLLNIDKLMNVKYLNLYDFTNENTEFDFSNNLKNFFGYVKENRLLEIIKEKKDNKQHIYFYAKYPINQIALDDNNKIDLLELNNNKFYLEKVKMYDNYCSTESLNLIDSGLVSSISFNQNNTYYWTDRKTNYSLINYKNDNPKEIFNVAKDSSSQKVFKIIKNELKSDNIFTSVKSNSKESFYWIEKNKIFELSLDNLNLLNINEDKSKIYSFSNKNYLFVYEDKNNSLKTYTIDKISKSISFEDSIMLNNLSDFFITNFLNKTYLIYTNPKNNLISFKTLNYEN